MSENMQVLLSAMYLTDYTYIDKLNIKSDCVVINQCDKDYVKKIASSDDKRGRNITFISSSDRGLSKSRNLAVKEAKADICIFCDNDVVYVNGYEDIIVNKFKEYPDADILVFFIERPERKKPFMKREGSLGYKGAMKVFSPEIAFRREALIKNKLYMNESFGAGAKYGMGEENIFLFQAIKKGLNVKYIPLKIASLMDTESTWFTGYNEKFFIDRGAGYYAMSRCWHMLLIYQFAIRKYKLYRNDCSMKEAIKYMKSGVKEYKGSL